MSRDTWPIRDDYLVDVASVLDWCAEKDPTMITGVTITGGEPSEQPVGLEALVDALAALRARHGWDLLCYTGVEEEEFAHRCHGPYAQLDALVTGPFQVDQPTQLVWRGSANQRLIPLTALGHVRYDTAVNELADRPSMQIHVDGDRVWLIGVPRRGDLVRIERGLATHGVHLDGVSWRP
jgi:anaerobic ribonucleoside-triphosphate reductase activating protein